MDKPGAILIGFALLAAAIFVFQPVIGSWLLRLHTPN